MKNPSGLLVLALLLALAAACGSSSEAPPPAAPAAGGPAPAEAGGPAPAALLPVAPAGGSSEAANAAGLHFELPAGWRGSEPSSNMRVAQATIPGPGGDGELAVFFFGEGQGGDVESNIQRWVGQMSVTPGTNPKRDSFSTNDLTISWVDVQGNLSATAMGNSAGTERGGWRLYGAVVEGQGGPWFFKATGPEATLAPQRDAFVAMLRSASAQQVRPGI